MYNVIALLLKELEECFGPHWFSTSEAWNNFFKTYKKDGFSVEKRKANSLKILEELWSEKFLEKTTSPEGIVEYRLSERAGVFRKPLIVDAPIKRTRTIKEEVFEYEIALKRAGTSNARPEDKAILTDARRISEYKKYGHFLRWPSHRPIRRI